MIEIRYTIKLLSPLRIGTGIGKAAYFRLSTLFKKF